MNKFISAAIAAFLILGSVAAQAQTQATTTSRTASQAALIMAPGAITNVNPVVGAAAATASSALNQPQLVMSTAGAPSTGTFNECGIAFSGGLWLLTLSYTGESKSCVAQRQALLMLQMGQGNMAFERMCDVPEWQAAAERTARKGLPAPECQSTMAARDKAQPVAAVATPAPASMSALTPAPAPVVPMRNACFTQDGREVKPGTRDANCWEVPLS